MADYIYPAYRYSTSHRLDEKACHEWGYCGDVLNNKTNKVKYRWDGGILSL